MNFRFLLKNPQKDYPANYEASIYGDASPPDKEQTIDNFSPFSLCFLLRFLFLPQIYDTAPPMPPQVLTPAFHTRLEPRGKYPPEVGFYRSENIAFVSINNPHIPPENQNRIPVDHCSPADIIEATHKLLVLPSRADAIAPVFGSTGQPEQVH